MKFWLSLILGTIVISAGLTYLNLYKGAQTVQYPPLPKKPDPAVIEFVDVKQPVEGATTTVLANAVTVELPEVPVGKRVEGLVRFKNVGKAALTLTLQDATSNIEVYFNDKRITGTEPRAELPPGQEGAVRLVWAPSREQVTQPEQPKTRALVRFDHNDDRFTDALIFELKAVVVK